MIQSRKFSTHEAHDDGGEDESQHGENPILICRLVELNCLHSLLLDTVLHDVRISASDYLAGCLDTGYPSFSIGTFYSPSALRR